MGGQASYHEESKAIGSLLLPYAATGVSLLVMGGRSGAPPRGQPWTSAVTLPQGCKGLSMRRMAVVWTFRAPSLGRHVHRELLRSVWLGCSPGNTLKKKKSQTSDQYGWQHTPIGGLTHAQTQGLGAALPQCGLFALSADAPRQRERHLYLFDPERQTAHLPL